MTMQKFKNASLIWKSNSALIQLEKLKLKGKMRYPASENKLTPELLGLVYPIIKNLRN